MGKLRHAYKLTVIIRDDSPMIHCNDNPSFRTVVFDLTSDQCDKLALSETHCLGDSRFHEDISRAILEPISEAPHVR